MELNREQIIKALGCCHTPKASDCNECGYRGQSIENGEYIGCSNRLMKDALALIKELTQANEMLSESYDHLEKTKDELLAEKSRLTLENERLRENNLVFAHGMEKVAANYYNLGCADTVRKMQERLKKCFNNEMEHAAIYTEGQVLFAIDQIAKEMVEDLNRDT